MTDEVLDNWDPYIESLELVPASGGVFEVTLDGEPIFSKAALGRHAHEGEIVELLRARLGPPVEHG